MQFANSQSFLQIAIPIQLKHTIKDNKTQTQNNKLNHFNKLQVRHDVCKETIKKQIIGEQQ